MRLSACTEALCAFRCRTRLVRRIMQTEDVWPALAGRVLGYLDLTLEGAAQELRKRARWRRVADTPRAYTLEAFRGWQSITMAYGTRARHIVMTGTCSRLPAAYQINESLAVRPPRRWAEERWVKCTARLLCSTRTILESAFDQLASSRGAKLRRGRDDGVRSATCPPVPGALRSRRGTDARVKPRSRAAPSGPRLEEMD